jgi:hypothetical protein
LTGLKIMMGHRQVEQAALFYEFSLVLTLLGADGAQCHRERGTTMTNCSKPMIFAGYLFIGATIVTTLLSERGVGCDRHVVCAPLPFQMPDMPEDGGHTPSHNAPLIRAVSTAAFTGSVSSSIPLGPRYTG